MLSSPLLYLRYTLPIPCIYPAPIEYEDFVGDLDAVDMRSNHVLGGVFYFNLIKLPPQSKVVNRWVMTQGKS